MGFFGKLKNAVTGGIASVRLELPEARRGEPLLVRVLATAKSEGEIKAVYVKVRATERAEVRDTDFNEGEIEREIVRGYRTSYEHKVEIAGGEQLEEGQEYSWEGEIQLPADVGPTFRGRMIEHRWEIQAGLDAFGNDPDSGWIDVEVE